MEKLVLKQPTNTPQRDSAQVRSTLANIKRMERIWRGRLHKLCRRRYGNHHLPDDASGRAMLSALLRFGLGAEAAMEDAPWLGSVEYQAMQRTARRMTWKDAGTTLIDLTYADRQACKLWLFAPCDVPMVEVQRRRIVRRVRADRERKRRKRQQQREGLQQMRNMNKRDEAILRMLAIPSLPTSQREGANVYRIYGPDWMPMSALAEEARHCTAFRCPDGWPLRNLRAAVHRTVKRLAEQGAIKTMLRAGRRGPILCVAAGKADTFCDGRSVAL